MKGNIMYLNLICIFVFIFSACSKKEGSAPTDLKSAEQLQLGTVSNLGIFDPALTYDNSNQTLWMSYSAVDTSAQLEPTQRVVSSRVAKSTDGGVSWTDQSVVIGAVNNVALSFPGLPTQGAWQNEVSKILYDPYSVGASDRWKLLTHHYLQVKSTDSSTDRHFEHGWISYKAAASPALLASATEIKLFGSAAYNSANNTLGGTTGSPVGGAPVISLQNLHADLNNCLIFTEPGVLSTPSKLFMSIICIEISNYKVALFSCPQPCSVTSGWSYIKTIFQSSDATPFGYLNFSASELFTYNNENYLMVTPEGVSGSPGIYHGCYVYKFSDIVTGTLASMVPVKTVSGTTDSFNGACTFNENAVNGFYYSEVDITTLNNFKIFKSNSGF